MSTVNPYAPPNPQPDDDPPLVAQLAVDGEGMTVEFEQVFEDLVTFAEFHGRQVSFGRGKLVILVTILVPFFMLLLIGLSQRPRNFAAMLPLVFGSTFLLSILLVLTLFRKHLVRRNVKAHYGQGRNLNLIGIRRITITPEYILFSTPLCQSATRWAGMEKVAADAHGIYLYNSSLTAYILPRRAFNSDQHFHEFLAKATEYLANHLRGERPLAKT
jgi:hypothetical protein